jgi:hypothetical protein
VLALALRHSTTSAQWQNKLSHHNTTPAFFTIMAKKKKKATPWGIAKSLLEEDYDLANHITDTMQPKDVVKL